MGLRGRLGSRRLLRQIIFLVTECCHRVLSLLFVDATEGVLWRIYEYGLFYVCWVGILISAHGQFNTFKDSWLSYTL